MLREMRHCRNQQRAKLNSNNSPFSADNYSFPLSCRSCLSSEGGWGCEKGTNGLAKLVSVISLRKFLLLGKMGNDAWTFLILSAKGLISFSSPLC